MEKVLVLTKKETPKSAKTALARPKQKTDYSVGSPPWPQPPNHTYNLPGEMWPVC